MTDKEKELVKSIAGLDNASITALQISANALKAREEVKRNVKKQSK